MGYRGLHTWSPHVCIPPTLPFRGSPEPVQVIGQGSWAEATLGRLPQRLARIFWSRGEKPWAPGEAVTVRFGGEGEEKE